MSNQPQEQFDETLMDFVERLANMDLASQDATTAMQNLERFSKCRPPALPPTPEPEPEIVPQTKKEKFLAGLKSAAQSENAGILIKAVGGLVGVCVVTYATIRKDHVIERQALAQANQKQ